MRDGISFSNLKEKPELCAEVTECLWGEWWHKRGVSKDYLSLRVQENLNDEALPFSIVAHRGDQFLGTVSVIPCDLDERQNLSPWVAALWVHPDARGQGVARALLERAVSSAFDALGVCRVYLCATAEKTFYAKLGWTVVEYNVGEDAMTVFAKDCALY